MLYMSITSCIDTNLYHGCMYQFPDINSDIIFPISIYKFVYHGCMYQIPDDYILGYEIVNEPWCGDVYEVPFQCICSK